MGQPKQGIKMRRFSQTLSLSCLKGPFSLGVLLMFVFAAFLYWLSWYQSVSLFMLIWGRQHSKLPVQSIGFSPDGSLLASGSQDGTIKLWRVMDGNLVFILKGHKSSVNSVAFSPEGQILISGGEDGTVNFWSTKSGELTQSPLRHKSMVRVFGFSPDGKSLALAIGNTVVIHRVSKGHSKRIFRVSQLIYCGAFSPDGKFLALGGGDNCVEVRRVSDGQLQHTLGRHIGSVFSVAFSPDGKLLASGGEYDDIRLWGVKDGKLICTLKGHQGLTGLGWTSSLVFSPDGQLLVSGGGDGKVRVWRTQKWFVLEEKRIRRLFNAPVFCISFSPEGRFLAIGEGNGFIYLFKRVMNHD